jgi:enoyl-CoA hydratase/carnithine racemase
VDDTTVPRARRRSFLISTSQRYRRPIKVVSLSDGELGELLGTPFAATDFVGDGGVAFVVTPGGPAPGADMLASLPCIVVATDRPAASPPAHADVVVEPDVASVDDVLATIDANPIASTALALLLRSAPHPSTGAGLSAESAVYSLLQAGPEFARWRAGRAAPSRAPDSHPAVRVDRDGATLVITLSRPEVRNALNRAMRDGLLDALALAAADPSLTSVVLRGEGTNFCSGGDLDEFGSFDDPASARVVRLAASIGRAIAAIADRVSVQMHGPCAGSGVELAAFASSVVAAPDTTFRLPEISLGLVPGAGGTVSVVGRVGRHRTALLALSGATIDVETALAWGLVDGVVARDQMTGVSM